MMKPIVTFHNFVNTPKNNSAVIYHGLHTILIPTKHTKLILVHYILVQNHHRAGDLWTLGRMEIEITAGCICIKLLRNKTQQITITCTSWHLFISTSCTWMKPARWSFRDLVGKLNKEQRNATAGYCSMEQHVRIKLNHVYEIYGQHFHFWKSNLSSA